MGEFFKSAFGQKLLATFVSAGLFVLAHHFPDLAAEIGGLAGGLGIGVYAYHADSPNQKKAGGNEDPS